MNLYFAPMEGLTDFIYRNLHRQYFPGIDRYYTPFLSPTVHRSLTPREQRELPAADTLSYLCIPQILTKVPEDFLWLAGQCRDLGYTEVNLNVGCPSGTVTAKGKGSGMLRDPDGLDRFLDAIFREAPLPVSIKTRIGFQEPEEFPKLLEIFNRYPIRELIIHPRVRKVFYNGGVHMDMFHYAAENSRNPLCFNGNITAKEQIETFRSQYPKVDSIMIGRGLSADPGMLSANRHIKTIAQFHNSLLEAYMDAFGSARNAMFRLKENWQYLLRCFGDSEHLGKKLRKTTDIGEYREITAEIFNTCPLLEIADINW